MKLSDFYYEAEAEKGARMPIPLKMVQIQENG